MVTNNIYFKFACFIRSIPLGTPLGTGLPCWCRFQWPRNLVHHLRASRHLNGALLLIIVRKTEGEALICSPNHITSRLCQHDIWKSISSPSLLLFTFTGIHHPIVMIYQYPIENKHLADTWQWQSMANNLWLLRNVMQTRAMNLSATHSQLISWCERGRD